ncbi:MAG: hypothetical protein ACRC6A_08795 [Fusobacteriaceae bacterium]
MDIKIIKNEIETCFEILIEKKLYIKKIKQNLFKEKKILNFSMNTYFKKREKIFNKIKEITKEKFTAITNLVVIGCSRVLRI